MLFALVAEVVEVARFRAQERAGDRRREGRARRLQVLEEDPPVEARQDHPKGAGRGLGPGVADPERELSASDDRLPVDDGGGVDPYLGSAGREALAPEVAIEVLLAADDALLELGLDAGEHLVLRGAEGGGRRAVEEPRAAAHEVAGAAATGVGDEVDPEGPFFAAHRSSSQPMRSQRSASSPPWSLVPWRR